MHLGSFLNTTEEEAGHEVLCARELLTQCFGDMGFGLDIVLMQSMFRPTNDPRGGLF